MMNQRADATFAAWTSQAGPRLRVAWSRGEGCLPLAAALGDPSATPLGGDLHRRCIEERLDLLVARSFPRFDLLPTVVPVHLRLGEIDAVTAAVGDGPHSPLAVEIAMRLATVLRTPVEAATVYRNTNEVEAALERLHRLTAPFVGRIGRRAVFAPRASGLIDTLTSRTLLVVGAAGGSWFHRQLVGPGHRLSVTAPGGAVMVRSAPRRCYQGAEPAAGVAVGPQISAADALRVLHQPVVPVADNGRLIGIVRASALRKAPSGATVEAVMEPPIAVGGADAIESAAALARLMQGSPVPVVDDRGWLIGVLDTGLPLTEALDES